MDPKVVNIKLSNGKEYKAIRKRFRVATNKPLDNHKTVDSYISSTRNYTNNTGKNITVCDRNGLRQIVCSKTSDPTGEFIIRNSYVVAQQAYKDLTSLFTTVKENANTDLSVWRKGFLANVVTKPNGEFIGQSTTLDIETTVNLDEINGSHGNVYVVEADIVVSTRDILEAEGNPFTDTSIHFNSLDNFLVDNNTSFSLKIDIVDNDNCIGNRYTKFFGEIRTIVPTKCENRENGITISTRESTISGTEPNKVITHIFNLSELEKLGLYKTKEEAEYAGDSKMLRAEELAKLEHDNLVLRGELTNDKTKHEMNLLSVKQQYNEFENTLKREALEREREHKELLEKLALKKTLLEDELEFQRQRNKDRFDERSNYRKDHFEDKSYVRKDTSEIIKYLPTMIIGIGAVLFALVKVSSNKS